MKVRPDPLHYKGKRILKYVPVAVQLCNYRLLHEPLEFYMSLTGLTKLHSSEAEDEEMLYAIDEM